MKLAVAIIHGIGTQPDSRDKDGQHTFAQSLIAGLRQSFELDIRVLRPVNIVGTRQNVEKLLPRFLLLQEKL